MNKIKLIAVTGTRLTGKDTFYKLLQENNISFVRYSFADNLKKLTADIAKGLFDKSIAALTPEQKEVMRPVWIHVGTEARKIDINIWAKRIERSIETSVNYGYVPVITDMRFLNEFRYYKNLYGDTMLLVNITRDGAPEPTGEEKIHGPEVAKMADYSLHWGTDPTYLSLRPLVAEFYQKFFHENIN